MLAEHLKFKTTMHKISSFLYIAEQLNNVNYSKNCQIVIKIIER